MALEDQSTQSFPIRVQVREEGALFGEGSEALFTLTIVADVLDATRYVPESGDGFLVALAEPGRTRIALPTALKVQVDQVAQNRDYFTILEGVLRGQKASIKREESGASRLSGTNPHTNPVALEYSISGRVLKGLSNSDTYQAVDDPNNPLSTGLYDIEIPDAPHRGGRNYPEATFGRTWFRIGHSGNRYLHTGRASDGCVTLVEQARWDDLYARLITARRGDNLSVGTLRVVD